ncbi:hypothetical protein ACFL5O_03385 [Myxococcota bacterium]
MSCALGPFLFSSGASCGILNARVPMALLWLVLALVQVVALMLMVASLRASRDVQLKAIVLRAWVLLVAAAGFGVASVATDWGQTALASSRDSDPSLLVRIAVLLAALVLPGASVVVTYRRRSALGRRVTAWRKLQPHPLVSASKGEQTEQ